MNAQQFSSHPSSSSRVGESHDYSDQTADRQPESRSVDGFEPSAGNAPPETERISAGLMGSIIATGSLAFMGILTETSMTVIFPELMREFDVDTATVQWITTAYILVVASVIPISSYLKRRFPLRSIFVAAVVLSIVGSAIVVLSHSFALLIVARVIQGCGAGIATPLMINIILEQSPRTTIGRLMGIGSMVITVAPAIGPTVGGLISNVLPWRALFIIVMPLMLIALAIGWRCIRQQAPVEHAYFNVLGFVSIVIGLAGLVLAVNQTGVALTAWSSGHADVASGIFAAASWLAGVGALWWFVRSSRRSFSPLLRLGVLHDHVVFLHLVTFVMMPMVGIGFGYVITNLGQISLGLDPFTAGTLILPGALSGAVFAPLGGWLYDRFGAARPMLITFGTALIGPLLLLVFSMHLTAMLMMLFYFVFAFNFAIGNANVITSAMQDVPRQFAPDVNALFNTGFQFGGAAGMAVLSTVLSMAQSRAGTASGPAFAHATAIGGAWVFAVMSLICVIALASLIRAFQLRARLHA